MSAVVIGKLFTGHELSDETVPFYVSATLIYFWVKTNRAGQLRESISFVWSNWGMIILNSVTIKEHFVA